MKIHLLFMQRREEDDNDPPHPEPILVWDDYSRQDASDNFDGDVQSMMDHYGDIAEGYTLVTVDVDGVSIRDECLRRGKHYPSVIQQKDGIDSQ